MKLYKTWKRKPHEYTKLRKKVLNYARTEFSLQKTVDLWDESMTKAIKDFKENKNKASWQVFEY